MAVGGLFGKPPSSVDVPTFVSALTPQGLVRAMLLNNLKLKGMAQYHSITFANGKWYAWFLKDLSDDLKSGKVMDNGASGNV